MRILAVNWQDLENPHAGGAEIHLFEILTRLVRRGHEVTVLCGGFPGCAPVANHEGVSVHRVGERFSFPLHAASYFRRHLSGVRFDVVLDDINKVPLCTPLWGIGAPVIAVVPHLFGTTAFQELPAPMAAVVWLSERPVPFIYRRSLFHVISLSTADDLVDRGVRRERIQVIFPGISGDVLSPDPSARSSTPLFLYLGRLKRYKGIDIILRAFARVTSPDARLAIAGKGDYLDELKRLVHSLGLEKKVSFLGFISEAEKVSLLRRAWGLVFTSPKEGWGIANIEAQACGTPVIASDSPGLRESVLPGETGVLVPHGDVEALARSLELFASSPEQVREMGVKARKFAGRFSWDTAARETEAHINLAIADAQKR